MSEGIRISRGKAETLAAGVMDLLKADFSRLVIAGSLRRLCPDVGDIELVGIKHQIRNLWGEEQPIPSQAIRDKIERNYPVIKGGEKYIQFDLGPIKCDLYLTTPEQWGVMYTLRTGSAYFSHKLVTAKYFGGYLPYGMAVDEGRLWKDGVLVPTPEEENLFHEIGLNYILPEERL